MASAVCTKGVETLAPSESEQISNISNATVEGALYLMLDVEDSQKKDWLSQAQERQQALTGLQYLCSQYCVSVKQQKPFFSVDSFCKLFSQENALELLFRLFDHQSKGQLVQSDFIDILKEHFRDRAEGNEFVDLLDTLWYVFVNEAEADIDTFCRIFKSKGVLAKLFVLVDANKTGQVFVDQVMAFFTECTLQRGVRGVEELQPGRAEELFRSIAKDDSKELDFEDFKKLIPSKNSFFAHRVFCIFDKDGSNTISMAEFREGLEQFCGTCDENKVRCLFQIYDEDGDGIIKLSELKAVLKACIEENGMKFNEEQLNELTTALYDDARASDKGSAGTRAEGLSYEELKAQMTKHPGLLENLLISLDRFLLPSVVKAKKSGPTFKTFCSYLKNNLPFVIFLVAYAIVNIGLFVSRIIQYKEANVFYILARACGNLDQYFFFGLEIGCASFLPLDQHVYLHKVCGVAVAVLSAQHTMMHLINFPLNVAGKLESGCPGEEPEKHNAIEWLFTTEPCLFGLIPGWANLTGWALVGILLIMVLCSLPCVRKSGSFEAFYWTHLLYVPFWILLIIHGPNFWYWFIGPGLLFAIEGICRIRLRLTGEGRTFISSAVLLPSRITHLVIRKPARFHFNPGDYVYVKIPAITSTEWHPFTISSSPELQDVLWLHIRSAGGWTNKLYEYFEREQAKVCLKQSAESSYHGQPGCQHCQQVLENKSSTFSTQSIMRGVRRLTRTFSSRQPVDSYDQLENSRMTLKSLKSNEGFTLVEKTDGDLTDNDDAASSTNRPPIFDEQAPGSSGDQQEEKVLRDNRQYRHMSHKPRVMSILVPIDEASGKNKKISVLRKRSTPRASYAPESLRKDPTQGTSHEENKTEEPSKDRRHNTVEGVHIYYPLEIAIDGPYGAPSSHIFRAQHAVLIAAGIGVTPFASILQSIMHRYYASRQTCPSCRHCWVSQMPDSIMNLKKLDFFWINRDQRSFEWFVDMLSQLEKEQAEMGGVLGRFLDLHMYITSALKKTDLKAVGLQMALDLFHDKEKRDLVTGLKTRTNAGRPNWDKVFQKLVDEDRGKVTVFYCGPPQLAKELTKKCNEFGFDFRKEIF